MLTNLANVVRQSRATGNGRFRQVMQVLVKSLTPDSPLRLPRTTIILVITSRTA